MLDTAFQPEPNAQYKDPPPHQSFIELKIIKVSLELAFLPTSLQYTSRTNRDTLVAVFFLNVYLTEERITNKGAPEIEKGHESNYTINFDQS